MPNFKLKQGTIVPLVFAVIIAMLWIPELRSRGEFPNLRFQVPASVEPRQASALKRGPEAPRPVAAKPLPKPEEAKKPEEKKPEETKKTEKTSEKADDKNAEETPPDANYAPVLIAFGLIIIGSLQLVLFMLQLQAFKAFREREEIMGDAIEEMRRGTDAVLIATRAAAKAAKPAPVKKTRVAKPKASPAE